eukprot:gene9838-13232_t
MQTLLLLLLPLAINSYWHAFGDKEKPNDCPTTFEEHHIQNSKYHINSHVHLVHKYRLWPGLFSEFDLMHGKTVPGFAFAIEEIWKNQHSQDCKDAKFLIAQGWAQGFGSEIHVLSIGLALALNMNRVYVMNPFNTSNSITFDNTWQVATPFCKQQGKVNLECYFEPWTSCSIEEIMNGKTLDELKNERHVTYFSDDELAIDNKLWDSSEKIILLENRGEERLLIPNKFKHLLDCSQVRNGAYFYWWRSISTAYIRGDKHVEMTLIDTITYLNHSQLLWNMFQTDLMRIKSNLSSHTNNNNNNINNNNYHESHIGSIFIGSEDPSAIDDAVAWGNKTGWKVIFTDLFDRHSVSASLNYSIQSQQRLHQTQKHHELEYFSMLLNLDYLLRCQAFVCTMESNFCRVIDELRSTVAYKANYHMVDLNCKIEDGSYCIDSRFGYAW